MSVSAVKSMCKIIAAMAFAVPLELAAAPKVVYVVPGGAGEKDGTSWENAYGSVHDAYASAAAFAEGGFDSGEVWVKRGMYIWPSKNSAITMVSGVSVRGGFVGTETSADQADGAANVTVFSGDLQSDAYWCPDGIAPKPIEAKHRIWTGDNDHLVYNEPNPDGTDKYWAINKSLNDVQKAFSGNGVTGCEFTGLHFACFVTSAISLSNTTGGAVTFRKCLFLGNDGAQNGGLYDGGIHCVYGHCSIYDCEFVANWSQLSYATDTLATGTGYTVISNCVFRKMASSGFYLRLESSAGLDDNTYRLQNCVFKDNYGSSMISVNATKLFRLNVEDCLFVSNRTVGSSIVYSQANSAGQMKFRRCVFADNVISNASNGACSGCVAMGGWGRGFFFNDCLFARNTLTYTGTTSGAAVIGQLLASYVSTAFVNCTFDRNKTISTAEGTYACIIGFLTDYMSLGIATAPFAPTSARLPVKMLSTIRLTSTQRNHRAVPA